MARFTEYDCFQLVGGLEDESIPAGTIGVVLIVHDPITGIYEVEFPDANGRNLGTKPTFSIGEDLMAPLEEGT